MRDSTVIRAALAVLVTGLAAPAASAAAPAISVNTTTTTHFGWVRVSYSGLAPNDATAWIGVYSPANNVTVVASAPITNVTVATPPWTTPAPIKFVTLAGTPGFNAPAGSGYYDFSLVNSYETVSFWLFTGGYVTPTPLTSSAQVSFSDATVPLRGHIARTADPTEMRVTWNSPTADDNPSVKWGTTPGGPYTNVAAASSTTYTADDLCGEPANSVGWFPPHFWHTAVMTGLTPGVTVVFYVYGSDANGWSAESTFKAAPAPSPFTETHVLLTADMGAMQPDGSNCHWEEPFSINTTNNMAALVLGDTNYTYSLLAHIGDIAYGTGEQVDGGARWPLAR
jgi:hypothetical protein